MPPPALTSFFSTSWKTSAEELPASSLLSSAVSLEICLVSQDVGWRVNRGLTMEKLWNMVVKMVTNSGLTIETCKKCGLSHEQWWFSHQTKKSQAMTHGLKPFLHGQWLLLDCEKRKIMRSWSPNRCEDMTSRKPARKTIKSEKTNGDIYGWFFWLSPNPSEKWWSEFVNGVGMTSHIWNGK